MLHLLVSHHCAGATWISVMDANLQHVLLKQAPFLDFLLPVLGLDDEKQRPQGSVEPQVWEMKEGLRESIQARVTRLSGPTG